MDEEPCSSGAARRSNKRKQPDGDDLLQREGPLTTDPIENEYEDLSGDDDASDEDGAPAIATHLKKSEINQIFGSQEPTTESRIDGIKITPFNLIEELQEGEFDKAGNFVFKRAQGNASEGDEEENDNWAESIDWDEVERAEAKKAATDDVKMEQQQQQQQQQTRATSETETDNPKDRLNCYKSMLRLMKPDEIVKKTIQRLGEGIPKRKPMNKNKRIEAAVTKLDQSAIDEMKRKLDLMIELAHQRLQDGDLDIYQKSYEDLEEAINC